jgi:hypothetical protein
VKSRPGAVPRAIVIPSIPRPERRASLSPGIPVLNVAPVFPRWWRFGGESSTWCLRGRILERMVRCPWNEAAA